MTQIMNFKKMEVTGTTKDEALAKAPFNASYKNATQAYRLWRDKQTNGITESDKKQFFLDYLAKNTKNVAGLGCYIVIDAAVADTRERPYRINDVKNESGSRKWKTVYQIKDKETNAVIAETDQTKAKAKEIVRNLYTDKGCKSNLICTYTKQVVEGQPIAFTVDYTPSKSSKVGTYLVFGIENN